MTKWPPLRLYVPVRVSLCERNRVSEIGIYFYHKVDSEYSSHHGEYACPKEYDQANFPGRRNLEGNDDLRS